MPTQVQFRRGNEGQNNNFKGAAGEISVNTSTNSVRVHNGITTGGFELARADLSNVGNVSLSGIVTATAFVGDGSGLTGIQDLTGPWVSGQVGIYTNSYVGIGTTNPEYDLHVIGNARITGILTIGNASITIDGNNNDINIGSGVTVYGNTGIISASAFYVGNVDLASASGYAKTAGIATYATNAGVSTYASSSGISSISSGLTTNANVNTTGIITASSLVGYGSSSYQLSLPVIDPYISNVSLLLHGDGANGSTSITDSSPSAKTINRFGSVALSNVQSKFGESSIYFPGTAGSYTEVSNSGTDFDFPGDFTVEFWFYWSDSSGGTQIIYDARGSNHFAIGLNEPSAGKIFLFYNFSFLLQASVSTGLWYHVAVSRSSGTLRLFLNGIEQSSASNSTSFTGSSTNRPIIGRGFNNAAELRGYLDEFRVTKGVGRYTSNFSVPTTPFPDNSLSLRYHKNLQISDLDANPNHLINNLGIGTTNPTSKLTVSGNALVSGVVTASSFVGDGSGLTNIVATGTGVEVRDNGTVVGTARTLDFGNNLDVTFSAGIMTVTGASGAEFLKNESGISTTSSVGIGTTQPVAKLHVNGAIAISASPIFMGKNTVEESVTVPSGYNAMSIGPILTVGTGVTVTVEAGANWFVLGQ
jgi:hypothetical protein